MESEKSQKTEAPDMEVETGTAKSLSETTEATVGGANYGRRERYRRMMQTALAKYVDCTECLRKPGVTELLTLIIVVLLIVNQQYSDAIDDREAALSHMEERFGKFTRMVSNYTFSHYREGPEELEDGECFFTEHEVMCKEDQDRELRLEKSGKGGAL